MSRSKILTGVALVSLLIFFAWYWNRDEGRWSPRSLQRTYGLNGAFTDRVPTGDGSFEATVVPVRLSDGRVANLIIPRDVERPTFYLQDSGGVHRVMVSDRQLSRREFVRSPPRVLERPAVTHRGKRRSRDREVLIVAGSAAAGSAIGAVAGGGKGAAVGAVSGGIAGLIYDLATRKH